MKKSDKLLAVLLALTLGVAMAEGAHAEDLWVASNGRGGSVVLTDLPSWKECQGRLARREPKDDVLGCWLIDEERKLIVILWEDGEFQEVNPMHFIEVSK